MRRSALSLLGFASCVLLPYSAGAFSLIQTSRSVVIWGTNFDPVVGPQPTGASAVDPIGSGPWISDLIDARDPSTCALQDSLITENELSGSGSVGKSGTGVYDSAKTQYHVIFALDTPTFYEFSVTNLEANGCCTWAPSGSVTLNQVEPNNLSAVLKPIYSIALGRDTIPADGGLGFANFSAQGTLAPGTYALDYDLQVGSSRNASAPGTASFAFAVIPERSTSLLVMVGLLSLAILRRRIALASTHSVAGKSPDTFSTL